MKRHRSALGPLRSNNLKPRAARRPTKSPGPLRHNLITEQMDPHARGLAPKLGERVAAWKPKEGKATGLLSIWPRNQNEWWNSKKHLAFSSALDYFLALHKQQSHIAASRCRMQIVTSSTRTCCIQILETVLIFLSLAYQHELFSNKNSGVKIELHVSWMSSFIKRTVSHRWTHLIYLLLI